MTIHKQPLDRIFHALSDPSRRRMIERVADGGRHSAGELGRGIDLAQPTLSRHLKVLEDAGLVIRHVQGRRHEFELGRERLQNASLWAQRHLSLWEHSLDTLADVLANDV